jgi:prepilin-type processing-associated H-X9-DG protein
MSNLRQLGIAATLYITEQRYYPGCYGKSAGQNDSYAVWPTRLRAVMKQKNGGKLFTCPSRGPEYDWSDEGALSSLIVVANDLDEGYGYRKGEKLLMHNDSTQVFWSYGYNDWGTGQGPSQAGNPQAPKTDPQLGLGGDVYGGIKELKASRVRKPAEMIMITDSGVPSAKWRMNVDPRDKDEAPSAIHRGGANVLWCDGHVSFLMKKELVLFSFPKDKPDSEFGTNYLPSSLPQYKQIARMWNNTNESWP